MSFAVDVNILLYASDRSSPFHSAATTFLTQSATGSEIMYLAWPTLVSYLRIATHAGVFASPLTPEEAMGNVDALLGRPHVRTLSEDQGFWDLYREVARATSARGNLVPDAHLATLLKQHGVSTLYSNDTDFRKFAFLRVVNPLRG